MSNVFKKNRNRLTRILWITASKAISLKIGSILNNVQINSLFDEKLIEKIYESNNKLDSLTSSLWKTNLIFMILLGLNLLIDDLKFSSLGISVQNINQAKEIILLFSAFISFFVSMISINKFACKAVITGWIKNFIPDEMQEIYKLKYCNIDIFSIPNFLFYSHIKDVHSSNIVSFFSLMFFISILIAILSYIAFYFGIRIIIILEILENPGLPRLISVYIISFVIFIDLITFIGILLLTLPLPRIDYRLVYFLNNLHEQDIEKYTDFNQHENLWEKFDEIQNQ